MDVQAANAAATPPSIAGPTSDHTSLVISGDIPGPAAPAVALLPPTTSKSLASDVAKLFGPQGANYSVSFRVATGSDQIVVVVTDKATGQTVSQFPSETLVALGQFFDKLDGSVVDKKV